MYMKKNNNNNNNNNNRFRSNNNNNSNNNQGYSLSYKFDSTSIAGKCCGTALDLIKKYNELAKEATSNHDYVSSEIFKQYAEHYRKIVTEINDKKPQPQSQQQPQPQNSKPVQAEVVVEEVKKEPQSEVIEQPKKSLRKKIPLTVVAAAQ